MKLFASQEWQAYTDTMSSWTLRDTNTFGQFTAPIHSHGKTLPCTPVVEPIYGRGDEQNSNGMDAAGAAESKAEPDWNAVPKAAQYHDQVYWRPMPCIRVQNNHGCNNGRWGAIIDCPHLTRCIGTLEAMQE